MKRNKLDIQPGFKNFSAGKKVLYIMYGIFMVALLFLVIINDVYTSYPSTLKGQEEAMTVAKDFTVALSGKEYYEAHKLLSPVTQRLMMTPESLGAGCENCRPISGTWERPDDDSRHVYGTIKFEDGKEMPAEISVKWYKGEFRITGAEFKDEKTDDSRMSFGSCCDKYSYFDWVYWLIPSLR